MTGRHRPAITVLPLFLSLAALAGCGGEGVTGTGNGNGNGNGSDPDNVAPTLGAVADQTVRRNTLSPRSVTVDLAIDDPDDDNFTVTVTSDDEDVLPATEMPCGLGACQLTLTPAVEENEDVTVTVLVADDGGGEAETSFVVHVRPALVVTTVDDDGAGSLRQAIADAEVGDVIGFDQDGVFGAAQTITLLDQLVLDKSVTVEGHLIDDMGITFSATLSGGDAVRVVKVVEGAQVTLRGLTVADGLALTEEIQRPGEPIESISVGGGIFVGPASTLSLELVLVTGSAAPGAGAVGGGIATAEGTINATFIGVSGNSAENGGGIGNIGGTVVLTLASVQQNTALRGGGVYNEGTLHVEAGSTIAMNLATGTGANDGGAGIFNAEGATARVVESDLEENDAANTGGGIRNAGDLTVIETEIVQNRGDDDGDDVGSGGGIANVGPAATASVVSSVIEDNTAQNGGGIHSDFLLTVDDSDVLDNHATDGTGGGIWVESGDVMVTGTTIAENTATFGAGVAFEGGEITVQGSAILVNVAEELGGGLMLRGDAAAVLAVVDGTVIEGNTAEVGGGISHAPQTSATNSILTVRNASRVTGNAATFGGGIFQSTSNDAAATVIENSTVNENTADTGGGFYGANGELNVQGSTSIDNNQASSLGGGIYVSQTETVITGPSVVIANMADAEGGGFYVSGGELTVTGTFCMILGNFADADEDGSGSGGGIFNSNGDIAGVPMSRVCLNSPDDIAP